MMIKDFLIEHYIYILIVIGLIIITIIGFLADKKMKGKGGSKEMLPNNNPNMENVNYGTPMASGQPAMNYQPTAPVMDANNQVANNAVMNNNVPNGQANFGMMPNNGAMPVNNMMPNPAPQSDATTNVMPGTIEGTIVNQNILPGQPVPVTPVVSQSATPINNMAMPVTPEPAYQPVPEVQPMVSPVEPVSPVPTFNLPNMQPSVTPQPMSNNMGYSDAGGSVSPAPIPTPVTPNIPVAPIPPAPSTPVNPAPIPNVPVANQATTPQPVASSPLNFTYGAPANNQGNNGYMQ